ncbi:hypothetical protein EXIGLDRAFT_833466 [Exidia glandulosa HHB12029]|uniref:TOM13-domain-containing protein n=1 Tax=Exidia glandulosa HHB12029 TaxID=1314781 RepID=A0A165KNM4_EXIGL|nr:hypothetical protein EXIGLDRAFT_833466 [Exidia glandulosa HHB12029]
MADEREMTPLEAAMASSFEYSPNLAARKVEPTPPAPTAPAPPAPSEPPPEPTPAESEDPGWKEEYDTRLAEWRAAAAVARDKAERERAKWEATRAEERKNQPSSAMSSFADVTAPGSGWQSALGSSTASLAPTAAEHPTRDSPSPADVRDLVADEHRGGHGVQRLEDVLGPRSTAPHAQEVTTTDEESSKPASGTWENVPSLSSSFPSLPSRPTPPDTLEPSPPQPNAPKAAPARSITLLLFDPTTSTRTRLLALAATLGINFALPFVNGVMIGFGEITAKWIVNWWRVGPKLSATALGMRSAPVL